jgi:hypothetical protein
MPGGFSLGLEPSGELTVAGPGGPDDESTLEALVDASHVQQAAARSAGGEWARWGAGGGRAGQPCKGPGRVAFRRVRCPLGRPHAQPSRLRPIGKATAGDNAFTRAEEEVVWQEVLRVRLLPEGTRYKWEGIGEQLGRSSRQLSNKARNLKKKYAAAYQAGQPLPEVV